MALLILINNPSGSDFNARETRAVPQLAEILLLSFHPKATSSSALQLDQMSQSWLPCPRLALAQPSFASLHPSATCPSGTEKTAGRFRNTPNQYHSKGELAGLPISAAD